MADRMTKTPVFEGLTTSYFYSYCFFLDTAWQEERSEEWTQQDKQNKEI